MTEQEIEVFHDSFERCNEDPAFIDRFYERFLASSPEIAATFDAVTLDRVKRMVKASLYMTMLACVRRSGDLGALQRVALVHDRHHKDIAPHLYDFWRDSLLAAVAECDRRFDAQVEAVWRRVAQAAADYMISKY